MKIQTLKLTDLQPLENNVRKHTETQVNEIMRSVKQFGQTRAIVIDEKNNILIGNGLHEAMLKLGMSEAFVYKKSGLSEVEKKKLILADNKTYALGADDYENIEAYLEEITATGDFDIAGFDEATLQNLMRDVDEVLQDVQSYGVLSPETIQQKQKVEERKAATSEENATETQINSGADALDNSDRVQYPDDEESPLNAVKTILCPSCGECIPID